MGLIFNRKSTISGSDEFANSVFRKKVPARNINKWDIKKVSKELGFSRQADRLEFEKILKKDRPGGLTREEVHEGLQKMIVEGRITEKKAMVMAKELGLERKDLRYFEDISEYNDAHPQKINSEVMGEVKKEEPLQNPSEEHSASTVSQTQPQNATGGYNDMQLREMGKASSSHSSATDESGGEEKNIWTILNKQNRG